MEYQKIINLLNNTTEQPSKFRTKNWIEVIDLSIGTYKLKNRTELKTVMFKQIFVIIGMHSHLLKESQQLLELKQMQQQDSWNKEINK